MFIVSLYDSVFSSSLISIYISLLDLATEVMASSEFTTSAKPASSVFEASIGDPVKSASKSLIICLLKRTICSSFDFNYWINKKKKISNTI